MDEPRSRGPGPDPGGGFAPRGPGAVAGRPAFGHDIDARGERLFYGSGRAFFVRSLVDGVDRRLGELPADLWDLACAPDGRVATIDAAGGLRLWSTEAGHARLVRHEDAPGAGGVGFDPTGRWLAAFGVEQGRARVRLVDLHGPLAARPEDLRRSDAVFLNGIAFHPSGRWLVTGNVDDAGFWSLDERHAHVFEGTHSS